MKKALIAMSGGVDSSVAALLMKQAGYECIGATMKLYDNEEIGLCNDRTCCSVNDIEDARAVCAKIGIPYHVFNFMDEFEDRVIKKFVSTYEHGGTPNPCIDCNRYLKFRHLFSRAEILGCDTVVTGHYASVEYSKRANRYLLKKGEDASKDQSYVLYNLTQEELSHTCFPLGKYKKTEIRQIAEENGFVNSRKRDSQDICFVPHGDYTKFMEGYRGRKYPEGDFVLADGTVVGRHKGIVRYTIGQRRGLGVSYSKPLYVIGKDLKNNRVILGDEKDLYSSTVTADDINLISVSKIPENMEIKARTRYNMKEQSAVASQTEDGKIKVTFKNPQRAATPGQALVLYDGPYVVGGGTII